MAIERQSVEIVSLLLEYEGIDVNIRPLMIKSYYFGLDYEDGKEEEKKKLKKMTPLYLAVKNENTQIVQLLLNHKNIDVNKKSIVYSWKYNGVFLDGVQHDEESKIKEVDKEETALHNAVSKGNIDITKLLLSNKNIDINATDKQGKKPIELTNNEEIKSLFNQ